MAKIRLTAKSPSMKMEDSFEDFIRFSRSKNLSEATIVNYERQFKNFHDYYDGDISGITGDTIMGYIERVCRANCHQYRSIQH